MNTAVPVPICGGQLCSVRAAQGGGWRHAYLGAEQEDDTVLAPGDSHGVRQQDNHTSPVIRDLVILSHYASAESIS